MIRVNGILRTFGNGLNLEVTINNYLLKGRRVVVDIYRNAKHARFLSFWLLPQNQQKIVLDIASYESQSERAKVDIGCFGKY